MKRDILKSCCTLLLLTLLCLSLGACGGDDGPVFAFDLQGNCYAPSVKALTAETFAKQVVGSGWKHATTFEIDKNGHPSGKDYYLNLVGAEPDTYHFESTRSLKSYTYVDAIPINGYHTYAYSFEEGSNSIDSDEQCSLRQIVSLKGDVMKAIVYLGRRSNGGGSFTQVYGYATYHRMTDKELEECQRIYSADLDHLQTLHLSIEEGNHFISGKELEFDVLQSNGTCYIEAQRPESCSIVREGKRVRVSLLENGTCLTVRDGISAMTLQIFSTDESLEPSGKTDLYDFTYTTLYADKEKKITTSDGITLSYQYGSMDALLRDPYYGTDVSRWKPTRLLVVDTQKKARLLPMSDGRIAFKDLIPESELEKLIAGGEGYMLSYKLELVNADGQVFQILPFKLVYKGS